MHSITIAQILSRTGINHKSARKIGNEKVELEFDNYLKANKVIEGGIKLPAGWTATIPDYKIYKVGVIKDVDTNLEDEYIANQIRSKYPNSKIERFTKIKDKGTNKEQKIKTKTIKIYMETEFLPKEVFIDRFAFKVDPYIQAVRQCLRCWRFNYSIKFCKRTDQLCVHCGEQHVYEEATCSKKQPRCLNCGMNHKSNDKICIKYTEQKEIRTTTAYQNISIKDARDIHRAGSHNYYRRNQMGLSYSAAARQESQQPNKRKREDMEQSVSGTFMSGENEQLGLLISSLNNMMNMMNKILVQNSQILKQNLNIINSFLDPRDRR